MLLALGSAVAAIALTWVVVVGWVGSEYLMRGDEVPHGCQTPAALGWTYEAVNYDIALDERLPVDNPDWLNDCSERGSGTAGTAVVSRDGVRLAGWYVPAGNGAPPTAPTVVVVHGGGVPASDALRYAAPIHDRWNVLLVETRSTGRASGDWMSLGTREVDDVRAMLDWLVQTKHPEGIATLGDSAGAAATATLARDDPRISALVLESPEARIQYGLEELFAASPLGQPPALTTRIAIVAVWLRTGVWIGDADPIDSIGLLGDRPVAISYGTHDTTALPERNALPLYEIALRAGVPVEIHVCPGARHGQVLDTCPREYAAWLTAFLERTIGSGPG